MSLLSESDSLQKALLQPTDMFQSYSLSLSLFISYFCDHSFALVNLSPHFLSNKFHEVIFTWKHETKNLNYSITSKQHMQFNFYSINHALVNTPAIFDMLLKSLPQK